VLKWPILANFCGYFGQFPIFISGNPDHQRKWQHSGCAGVCVCEMENEAKEQNGPAIETTVLFCEKKTLV
jgi:hypothetical protein